MTRSRRSARSRWGTVIRRGQTWYVRFRWPRGGREYKRAVGSDRLEAERRLLAIEAALKNGAPIREVLAQAFGEFPSNRPTFRQAASAYVDHARRRRRQKTLAGDAPRLAIARRARWAGLPLEEITAHDIQRWLDQIQDSRKLAGGTLNRYASSISAVFRWAGKRELCPRRFNPAREIERYPESSGRENYLTPEELEAWIAAAPAEFRVMALLYARTGFRRDEARLLRWRSVDLARRTLRVEAELSKNRRAREVEMTPDLTQALSDHRDRQTLAGGRIPAEDDFVFHYRRRPWSTRRLYDAFHAAVAGCGDSIPEGKRRRLRLHDIRHTVGAILATRGVPLEVIAKVLGHKSLETTRRYAHLMPQVLSYAARVLHEAIPGPPTDEVREHPGPSRLGY